MLQRIYAVRKDAAAFLQALLRYHPVLFGLAQFRFGRFGVWQVCRPAHLAHYRVRSGVDHLQQGGQSDHVPALLSLLIDDQKGLYQVQMEYRPVVAHAVFLLLRVEGPDEFRVGQRAFLRRRYERGSQDPIQTRRQGRCHA